MIQHSPHSTVGGEVTNLWQNNRPLFLTIVIALVFGAYLLIRNSQAGASAAATTGGPSVANTYITSNTIQPAQTGATPGSNPTGPNPWLQAPPPGVDPATWNPYQYSNTPTDQQWPKPPDYVSHWSGGATQ